MPGLIADCFFREWITLKHLKLNFMRIFERHVKEKLSLIVLQCYLLLAVCTLKSENVTQNSVEKPFQSTERVAENSKTALNIDRYLSAMEGLGFSGANIVSESDEIILRKGYGYANPETD